MNENAKITFYVAECMEFPDMGEHHENISNLQDAIALYEQMSNRTGGIKGIGFTLSDDSIYDGMPFTLMSGGRVDRDLVEYVPHYKESPLVQEALDTLEKSYPAKTQENEKNGGNNMEKNHEEVQTPEKKKYCVEFSFGKYFNDSSFSADDYTCCVEAGSAREAAELCSEGAYMEDAIYQVYELKEDGQRDYDTEEDFSFRPDPYTKEQDPTGIKNAIIECNRLNQSGDWEGTLMYDTSSGRYWTDEFYGHNSWNEYEDPDIVSLNLDHIMSGYSGDNYYWQGSWSLDDIDDIAEIVQDYVDENYRDEPENDKPKNKGLER